MYFKHCALLEGSLNEDFSAYSNIQIVNIAKDLPMTEKGFCSDVGECEELKQGWMLKLGGIAMRNETLFWSIS